MKRSGFLLTISFFDRFAECYSSALTFHVCWQYTVDSANGEVPNFACMNVHGLLTKAKGCKLRSGQLSAYLASRFFRNGGKRAEETSRGKILDLLCARVLPILYHGWCFRRSLGHEGGKEAAVPTLSPRLCSEVLAIGEDLLCMRTRFHLFFGSMLRVG